ncbi:hypothetical protein [Arthrobacter glacialis]|uniref:Uncharacterized protein n=1 Tax=Arthrobacter glacialis TaxID=1664 RepID=A0A2S3ZV74_ARTGL|nr:hypothetical protein [Arthrobacter glacialis]POH60227.1 hypothetical protein CVS28_04610 [Arthrobacter glacialis]POH73009.1 hypothetical protein CVS27_12645 [Arthrobacter glacialis]
MLHKLGAAIFAALLVFSLAACSLGNPQKAGDTFVADASAAIDAVPNVVSNKTRFTDPGGMGAVINVRITAVEHTDLDAVLRDSLHAFADASGSLKGVSRVEFYVFPEGEADNGIRPDVLGLSQSPTVQEIRDYTSSNG